MQTATYIEAWVGSFAEGTRKTVGAGTVAIAANAAVLAIHVLAFVFTGAQNKEKGNEEELGFFVFHSDSIQDLRTKLTGTIENQIKGQFLCYEIANRVLLSDHGSVAMIPIGNVIQGNIAIRYTGSRSCDRQWGTEGSGYGLIRDQK